MLMLVLLEGHLFNALPDVELGVSRRGLNSLAPNLVLSTLWLVGLSRRERALDD